MAAKSVELQITPHQKSDAAAAAAVEKPTPPPTVPYSKLFAYSDGLDKLLMFLGSLGALANGKPLLFFHIA